ncbi:helix-turn-helix domain-containing protein [Novosphingobium sp. CF614]|uniref:helix-turn-helix domain-containing protein n=1 Tax=Novosphingobium sp. CF614 TaxID=1884364 RepID=UPI0015A66A33|nr:helix-turn-helix domain-containing protein [Novosphingobium sp. CF614]
MTSSVPPPQRIRRWNELGSDTLSELRVDPLNQQEFKARMQRVEIGRVGLVFIETTPASARSSASHIGGWAAPDRDSFVITLAERGSCTVSQDNWSAELNEGDIVVRDLAKPWSNCSTQDTHLTLVKIPFVEVASKIADPERMLGRHLRSEMVPVRLAASIIHSCREAILAEPDGPWQPSLQDILADVLKLIFDSSQIDEVLAGQKASSSVRREAIGFAMRHLDDPDLNVGELARGIGVSMRQLQRAFIEYGTTPRRFIQDRRLDRAAEMIAAMPDRGSGGITAVAFAVGFNDASHFSRAFARRFGCSPKHHRGSQTPR